MCYKTQLTKPVKDLELRYNIVVADERLRTLFDEPNYHINGFAHPNMLIIPMDKPDVLAPGVWGIVPFDKEPEEIREYYKEAVKFGSGLNAQSEKLFKHFIYRNVALTRRCIIPVTGFFEPHTHKNKSYPYFIKRQDNGIFSLAGIYTVIGSFITFTILTKAASPLMERIHNKRKRQPILLRPEDEQHWMDNTLEKDDVLDLINQEYRDEELEAYTVSKDLYKTSIDSNKPYITERIDYPELVPELF